MKPPPFVQMKFERQAGGIDCELTVTREPFNTKNSRQTPVVIRYPQSLANSGNRGRLPAATAPYPLPISIQTETTRLELIQAGSAYSAPCPGVYRSGEDADNTGWVWAVFTNKGDPLGFVSLNPAGSASGFDFHFGPHLDIACRRDRMYASFVPDVIAALLNWLRAHDICFVIHASHSVADSQMAGWLIAAGFLYTGCRSRDGRQQMICLL